MDNHDDSVSSGLNHLFMRDVRDGTTVLWQSATFDSFVLLQRGNTCPNKQSLVNTVVIIYLVLFLQAPARGTHVRHSSPSPAFFTPSAIAVLHFYCTVGVIYRYWFSRGCLSSFYLHHITRLT